MSSHFTIKLERDFELNQDQLFAHWTSPETRQRWEAGPDTGMTYDAFDTRQGGVEIVRMSHKGQSIGHMEQHIVLFEPPREMIIQGVFHGKDGIAQAINFQFCFDATDTGSRLRTTTQVIDRSGEDGKEEQEAGWRWLLSRFEADIAKYGPVI